MIGWRQILVVFLIVVVGLSACVLKTRPVHHGVVHKQEKHKKHHDNGKHRGDKHDDHHH